MFNHFDWIAPIYDRQEIIDHLPRLLHLTEAGRRKIRLLGISLSKLTPQDRRPPRQLPLPFLPPSPASQPRAGSATIALASAGG